MLNWQQEDEAAQTSDISFDWNGSHRIQSLAFNLGSGSYSAKPGKCVFTCGNDIEVQVYLKAQGVAE